VRRPDHIRPLTPAEEAATAEFGAMIVKVAEGIVAIPPPSRDAMIAHLSRSRNPLDRTIAAEARKLLAPAAIEAKTA